MLAGAVRLRWSVPTGAGGSSVNEDWVLHKKNRSIAYTVLNRPERRGAPLHDAQYLVAGGIQMRFPASPH